MKYGTNISVSCIYSFHPLIVVKERAGENKQKIELKINININNSPQQ